MFLDCIARAPRIVTRVVLALAGGCAWAACCAPAVLAADAGAAPKSGYRQLAPGVETTAPRVLKEEETGEAHNFTELKAVPNLEWTPFETEKNETLYAKATDTVFRRGIWQFQFSFKPLRLIRVDLPQADGTMRPTLIWYMVYRIINPGQHMTPVQAPEQVGEVRGTKLKGVYTVRRVDDASQMLANLGPIRFIPIFKLKSLDPKVKNAEWMDQIVPLAKEPIYRRERPPCKLENFYNTVEIARDPIPLSTGRIDNSVWGVVTWIGGDPPKAAPNEIHPRLNFFAIYIWGLTNAYKWADPPGSYAAGDAPGTGRTFVSKVLKINYTRPGDEFFQRETAIHLGMEGQLDFEWVYR